MYIGMGDDKKWAVGMHIIQYLEPAQFVSHTTFVFIHLNIHMGP